MSWLSDVIPLEKDRTLFLDFPRDMDDWTCAQFKLYYQRLKVKYAKEKAISLFEIEVERVGWFAEIHDCKYNCAFINYFKTEGLRGGNFISKIYCAGSTVVDAVQDTTENIQGAVSVLTNKNLLIGGALLAGYLYFKNSKYGNRKKK